MTERNLLIHMGGLGDVCLSESTFYSLSEHFQGKLLALGVKKYLRLFSPYFESIDDIGSSRYLFLFSEDHREPAFDNVILIGKDKRHTLRRRLERISRERMIFIDMYPEGERIHVEEYQLNQLDLEGIKPKRKELTLNLNPVIILYPERRIRKAKWEHKNYLDLRRRLNERGISSVILSHERIDIFGEDLTLIEDLDLMKEFLKEKGGIFVSSDGGCAHLACALGLFTVTLFFDTDPYVWHPRRNNVFITPESGKIGVEKVTETLISLYLSFFRDL
ncbi:MAG: glycosyltransferase family 9 protein [Nitrososphaerales archaeon]